MQLCMIVTEKISHTKSKIGGLASWLNYGGEDGYICSRPTTQIPTSLPAGGFPAKPGWCGQGARGPGGKVFKFPGWHFLQRKHAKPLFYNARNILFLQVLYLVSLKKSTLCYCSLFHIGVVELNTITMVVPFAATAAWLWQISHPYPWEPLWKG